MFNLEICTSKDIINSITTDKDKSFILIKLAEKKPCKPRKPKK